MRVHGLNRSVQVAEDKSQMRFRRGHGLAGRDYSQRGRTVGTGAESQSSRGVETGKLLHFRIEIEVEAVTPGPSQLADEKLSQRVIAQHEHGLAITAAAIASVEPVSRRRHVVPVEVTFFAPACGIEISEGIKGQLGVAE